MHTWHVVRGRGSSPFFHNKNKPPKGAFLLYRQLFGHFNGTTDNLAYARKDRHRDRQRTLDHSIGVIRALSHASRDTLGTLLWMCTTRLLSWCDDQNFPHGIEIGLLYSSPSQALRKYSPQQASQLLQVSARKAELMSWQSAIVCFSQQCGLNSMASKKCQASSCTTFDTKEEVQLLSMTNNNVFHSHALPQLRYWGPPDSQVCQMMTTTALL